ncbi:hypothetical protein VNO78_18339 [Psophocarpus tetragonolobus]|uniref:Uncharacterized protein n=1 Tax=Psophocarpus tetragonolobus TaxID=3891 RepID=A0AAN9SPR5_PSOTE
MASATRSKVSIVELEKKFEDRHEELNNRLKQMRVCLLPEHSLSIFLTGLEHSTQMHVHMFNPTQATNLAKLWKDVTATKSAEGKEKRRKIRAFGKFKLGGANSEKSDFVAYFLCATQSGVVLGWAVAILIKPRFVGKKKDDRKTERFHVKEDAYGSGIHDIKCEIETLKYPPPLFASVLTWLLHFHVSLT